MELELVPLSFESEGPEDDEPDAEPASPSLIFAAL